MNKWISVKDKLPDCDFKALILSDLRDDGAFEYLPFIGYYAHTFKDWYVLISDRYERASNDTVVYWMPIPSYPKWNKEK